MVSCEQGNKRAAALGLTGEEELVLVRRGARRAHHRSAVVGKDEFGSVLDAAPDECE